MKCFFPAKIIWRGEIFSRSPIHRKRKKTYIEGHPNMRWLLKIKKTMNEPNLIN